MVDYANRPMSSLRKIFFPIYREEYCRFGLMACMIFFSIFSFYLLRTVKDALVQSAPGSGAEVFSFLKLYLVLPATMLVMAGYVALRRVMRIDSCYYAIVSAFMFFFMLFALLLYPNVDYLHPSMQEVKALQQSYPMFKWFFTIYSVWVYALFYVVSELWGSLLLSVMFWQIANDNIPTSQAARFYPLFVATGNVAMICLNPVLHYLSQDSYNDIIQVCAIVQVVGLILMGALYSAFKMKVLHADKMLTDKKLPNVMESFRIVMRSPYVICISIMVLSYGLLINIVEAMWKSQVGFLYTDRSSLMRFNADYTLWMGVATLLMNYLSKRFISQVGWTISALITPIVCAFCGSLFFFFVLHTDVIARFFSLPYSLLTLCVWFGAFTVMLSKGAKYSFFDPTKEMAFIPLEKELRGNGKVVADGMIERIGKSMGGATISSLIMFTGYDLHELGYYLALMTVVLGFVWFSAVIKLGGLYRRQTMMENAVEQM